jgi:hypothetical protein
MAKKKPQVTALLEDDADRCLDYIAQKYNNTRSGAGEYLIKLAIKALRDRGELPLPAELAATVDTTA